jgi:hypothetical protein
MSRARHQKAQQGDRLRLMSAAKAACPSRGVRGILATVGNPIHWRGGHAVTFQLVLVLAALSPFETETQMRVRKLEEQLRPFPPAEVIADNCFVSNRYYDRLREVGGVIPSHQREAFAVHLAEAERLRDAWSSLAKATKFLKHVRCQADGGMDENERSEVLLKVSARFIKALETNLGEEAFRAGRMPPPVPYWRFQWVD